jgi:Mn-dependent DtxR family transcriptional regulator
MIKPKSTAIRKLKPVIEEVVEQKLYEILGDPDEGLKLKPSVKKRLTDSVKKNQKGAPAKQIAKELGLNW